MRRRFVGLAAGYGFGVREEDEGHPLRELLGRNPFLPAQ
jgi:hypothetical protein